MSTLPVGSGTPAPLSLSPTAMDVPGRLRDALVARVPDYLQIIKPKISLLVLLAVSAGWFLAPGAPLAALWPALIGVALVATGSTALNQWYERDTDCRMTRTINRPLPSGRLSPLEVGGFGLSCGVVGVLWLALTVNPLTATLAGLTFLLYTAAYTPLKRMTGLATAVGAIPGAMPPVLGWTAAGGSLDAGAWSLFAIVFLWQFPHFLAIAWIYKDDYSNAGLKMLPAGGRVPHLVGLVAVGYSLVLLPLSLLPVVHGIAGRNYCLLALVLGTAYAIAAARFAISETRTTARRLLWVSLVYLPLVLLTLVWSHWLGS